MQKLNPHDSETQSADILADNIAQLRTLFPEAFTEGKIDFGVLRQLLGGAVDEREEKYGLNWHGKRQARQLALTPSMGTLRPCPEESVDWDTTQNLMIEGDNLEVLKLLQKSYVGKVKLIYIDPPYNTGRDFVYRDDFRDNIRNYLELTEQVEGGRKISSNTEASGRFHTDWLNMMYPRLKLARNLLRGDGVIAISIDDGEEHLLRAAADEIFGEHNLICTFVWKSKSGGANDSRHVAVDHEYVVMYARDAEAAVLARDAEAEVTTVYNQRDDQGEYSLDRLDKQSLGYVESLDYPIVGPDGTSYRVEHKNPQQKVARWRWSRETVSARYDELVFKDGYVYTRNYRKQGALPRSLLVAERFGRTRSGKTELAKLMGMQVFDNPKPTRLLRFLVGISTMGTDLVLDFFAGSATAADAVMSQNSRDGGTRRSVLVQLPEPLEGSTRGNADAAGFCESLGVRRNIAELTKERLRRAAHKIREDHPDYTGDLGFRVFKLDSSNIRRWDADAENLEQQLFDAVEHVKPDRAEADVLYELLLKLGLDLCVPLEQRTIADKEVYAVGGGVLMACLSTPIARGDAEALAQGIAAWHDQMAPAGDTTCVFRDSAFSDDVAKTNLTAILEQHGITHIRSL
jgi:adenine-specific DNA-methyltransferase